MRCPYCGNSSGKTDNRGMCVSCGGNLERDYPSQLPDRSQPYQGITGGWASGGMITGSSYIFGETGMEILIQNRILSPYEVRQQLERNMEG